MKQVDIQFYFFDLRSPNHNANIEITIVNTYKKSICSLTLVCIFPTPKKPFWRHCTRKNQRNVPVSPNSSDPVATTIPAKHERLRRVHNNPVFLPRVSPAGHRSVVSGKTIRTRCFDNTLAVRSSELVHTTTGECKLVRFALRVVMRESPGDLTTGNFPEYVQLQEFVDNIAMLLNVVPTFRYLIRGLVVNDQRQRHLRKN